MQLRRSSFGPPAASFVTPYSGFANDVLFGSGLNGSPAVYLELYPVGYLKNGITQSRDQILVGGSVFRYKWLMFGQDPGGSPAILNLFEQTFGDTGQRRHWHGHAGEQASCQHTHQHQRP